MPTIASGAVKIKNAAIADGCMIDTAMKTPLASNITAAGNAESVPNINFGLCLMTAKLAEKSVPKSIG